MLSILMVDDHHDLRRTLAEFLRYEGHSVTEASCGEDALASLSIGHFDIVISDIEMPNGSGLWLLKELSARKSKVPVVLMSGNNEYASCATHEHGAVAFLSKPFLLNAVLNALQAARPGDLEKKAVGSK